MIDESALLFTETHEWVRTEGDLCTIGISRFAVEQLTDIVYIELPAVGTRLAPRGTFGVIESVKAVSDLYSPVAGEVVAVNDRVATDPSILSNDPYENGWMIRVRAETPPAPAAFLSKAAYDAKCAAEAH